MAIIKPLNGKSPVIGDDCWIAENATIVGDVQLGKQCTVWYNAVLRGDVHYIKIGNRVNIQDGTIIHCEYQTSPTSIGSNVTIGHNAVVHGCTVHDNSLIGMGAIVMNDAVIHSGAIVAAGAVVMEGKEIKPGEIWAGLPAKKVKELNPETIKKMVQESADRYVKYAEWYK